MERYNEYKDSGVQWLGEIPSHWECEKAKRHFQSRKQIVGHNSSQYERLALTLKGVIKRFEGDGVGLNPEKLDTYQIVDKDDLIFKLIDLENVSTSRVGLSPYKGIVSPAYIRISAVDEVNIRFAEYYYLNMWMRHIFNDLGTPGVRSNLSSTDLLNLPLLYPSIVEQKAIASYLDTATAKIDEAIAQQQKMIDLLNERKQIIINNAVTKGLNPDAPMKDSGVDWIGEIPEHWEIKKLKHVCQAFGRIGFRGYSTTDLVDEGEGCITLSPSNMRDGKMQYGKCTYLSWEKYEESPEIKVFNGDILFVKTGSTYGKSSIVEDLPLEATINPQLLVFKNFTCNNMFLANVLQSTAIKTQVEISVIGGTIPTISQQKILNYVFPFPTEDEQYAIVEYVESKSAPINSAIKAAEKQIALLQERKQIIINDVVTGKVKVC